MPMTVPSIVHFAFAARLKGTSGTQLNAAIDYQRFDEAVCDVRDLDLV